MGFFDKLQSIFSTKSNDSTSIKQSDVLAIVNAFHNHNIYLNRNEYKDLLGLKPGTLSVQNIKNNLIELKKRL